MRNPTAPLTREAVDAAINQVENSRNALRELGDNAEMTTEDFERLQAAMKNASRGYTKLRYVENRAERRKREQAERRADRKSVR